MGEKLLEDLVMSEFDLVIKNGMIVDGTRLPRYRADVGIKDGVIAKIGRLEKGQAEEVIDAEGLIVAPGFVDLHTHYDAQIYWDPYCSISGWHGVTSAVIGNCGFGFAPVRPEDRERSMLTMTRVEAIPYASMKAAMPWDWTSFPEFLDSIDRTPKGINLLPYVPVAPIMVWVMGLEDAKSGRLPTDAETKEMCRLIHEGMDAGGCGWSAQRLGPNSVQMDYDGTPMVTDIMHDETCIAFGKVLAERNEGFIQSIFLSPDGKNETAQNHFEESSDLKEFENLKIKEVAARQGKHPVDAMLDLAVADNLKTEFYTTIGCSLPYLSEIVQSDLTLLGVSDGGAHTKFFTAGRYPTETIESLVRENEVMSLEEAHWKLSALPSWCAGFKNRGTVREGAPADLVVYDFDNLKVLPMEIARDLPGDEWRRVQRAEGYHYVLVNGEVTIRDDTPTGETPGKLLRHGEG